MLNSDLRSPPPDKAKNFTRWRRVELAAGTEMFKFTQHAVFQGKASETEWWALSKPNAAWHDPGFDEMWQRAGRSGRPLVDYFRDAYAVMYHWNMMSNLGLARAQHVRLREKVFGFHGPASPQVIDSPLHKPPSRGVFVGGAMQLYIPNLTSQHLAPGRIVLLN